MTTSAPLHLTALLILLASAPPAPAQAWEWARRGGGAGLDHGFDVAVTAAGDVYVTGGFVGTASFGPFTLTSAGGLDAFLVRYAPDGTVVWARRGGGAAEDRGRGVAVDADGNVYVAGGFFGTAAFGTLTLTSAGSRDIYVAKYSPAGEVLWVRRAGGVEDDFGLFLSLDAAGDAYVTGRFQQTADFGTATLASAGGNDVFLAKYAPTGDVLWARRGGSDSPAFFEIGLYATTDAAGNTHLTGRFEQTADFGPFTLTSAGSGDIFLVTYSADGDVLRALRGGGPGDDYGHGVAAAEDGGLYVTGWFFGSAVFGTQSLTSAGGFDAFLVRYSAAGEALWARHGGGPGEDRGLGVAVRVDGAVFTTGFFSATADFGIASVASAGGFDIFLVVYTPDGDVLLAERAGGTGNDAGYLMDTQGTDAFLTGYFTGSASFGPHALTSFGADDAFVARFASSGVGIEEGPDGAPLALSAVRPSPAAGRAALELTAREPQRVRVELFDALGRRVALLFEGAVAAGAPQVVALDASALAPGMYLVRVIGESAALARVVAVARR